MRRRLKKGFTLVELSISIAFISILAITVILIIRDTVASYHRGLMLGQINTAGVDITDEIRATVQASPSRSLVSECARVYSGEGNALKDCENDGAHNFVSVVRLASLRNGTANVPVFGAFCTGNYSYIWNSGYFWNEDTELNPVNIAKATLRYTDGNGADQTIDSDFRLLKVQDEARSVCISATKGGDSKRYNVQDLRNTDNTTLINSSGSNVFDIRAKNDGTGYGKVFEEPVEAMPIGESSLALYDLSVATPAATSDNSVMLYSVSFILGTVQGGMNVKSNGNYCGTPSDYGALFDYCAINKFNFAVRATGE